MKDESQRVRVEVREIVKGGAFPEGKVRIMVEEGSSQKVGIEGDGRVIKIKIPKGKEEVG